MPIFSAHALDKENTEYWSTPDTLIQQIKLRGAKSVVHEVYDKPTVWFSILQKIAIGDEEWLVSAVALREGSDAGASEMLELSVGEALGNNPKNVFTVALKAFGIPAICRGPDVDDARFNSYELAIREINRRTEKVATVKDSPLTKECIQYLEASKKGISDFYGIKYK